jgi:lycopene beta-cyclase
MDYDLQLENYIKNNLGIKSYKINFMEKGAIPLFYPSFNNDDKTINIGSAGGMTRLSTGYTFLNIQEHSNYIMKNINKIEKIKKFSLGKKYQRLDKIFLKVLKDYPERMPKIFFDMFKTSSSTIIKFLSNKSNIFEDLLIILKMPKWIFLKKLF